VADGLYCLSPQVKCSPRQVEHLGLLSMTFFIV
jgi:hypothetical protein